MSRLSRLRSFWRSLRRGQIKDGGSRPHRAVNLLPVEYRDTGTLLGDGSWVLSASTGTKERGTRTPGTATTAVCSFWLVPGAVWEGVSFPPTLLPGSSSTGPGSFIYGTAALGASGAPRGLAT